VAREKERSDWLNGACRNSTRGFVLCRHQFSGASPVLHYGFDGWQEPIPDPPLEQAGPGLWVAEVDNLDGHAALDCAVTDGLSWNNNAGLDHRLWIGFEVVDSHLHISGAGSGDLGLASYLRAADSAGIETGIVSWPDHRMLDRLNLAVRRLSERFPTVPVIMYHTYLGPHEGRRRAVAHALEQPSLYLETSVVRMASSDVVRGAGRRAPCVVRLRWRD
jgi:hypothetical protein